MAEEPRGGVAIRPVVLASLRLTHFERVGGMNLLSASLSGMNWMQGPGHDEEDNRQGTNESGETRNVDREAGLYSPVDAPDGFLLLDG